VMLGGGLPGLAEHIPSDPFDVEQDYWDASAYDLVAWGVDGGFSESYTIILHKDPIFVNLLRTILTVDIELAFYPSSSAKNRSADKLPIPIYTGRDLKEVDDG